MFDRVQTITQQVSAVVINDDDGNKMFSFHSWVVSYITMKKTDTSTSFQFSFKFVILFAFGLFCFLAIFSSGSIESEDGWLYLTVARNIYYKHQISAAPNEYPLFNVNMNSMKGADGIWRAPGSLGYSLAMVPAVAFSDVLLNRYNATPPIHFPLESDWTVLFFASFTNIFFAVLLSIGILFYANALNFSAKSSILISLLTILATNLWPFSKFSFAQMMFTCFLVWTFYFVKRFQDTTRLKFLLTAVASFVIMAISYNIAYYLTLPALFVYFFLKLNTTNRRRAIILIILLTTAVLIFKSREILALLPALKPRPKSLFEGAWGLVLSPGKSIFLYSPILTVLPIFWHKYNYKKYLPELISFLVLSATFLYAYGQSDLWGLPGKMSLIWHGGMSWGPRYLLPLTPFLTLLSFLIIRNLTKLTRRLIIMPLICASIGVQLIGISVPYLVQYSNLPYSFKVETDEFGVYEYASFIPRYSPLWKMPHIFYYLLKNLPSSINHGKYNVRFFDGFDTPLHSTTSVSRGFRVEGHILFTPVKSGIQVIKFTLVNLPDSNQSSASAQIKVSSEDKLLANTTFAANEEQTISVTPTTKSNQPTHLVLQAVYKQPTIVPHVIYIKSMTINDSPVNLASLDYPDVSSLGFKTTPIPYEYFGNRENRPWKLWDMRARLNENSLDFWWIKNLYFWDRPQNLIWTFLALDLTGFFSSLIILGLIYPRTKPYTTH